MIKYLIDDVDNDKILMSNKVSFGQKGYQYFIGYKYDDYKINPLCIMLSKIRGYVKSSDENKYISFFIKDDKLLKNYNKIWDTVSNGIKKGFDGEPIYI